MLPKIAVNKKPHFLAESAVFVDFLEPDIHGAEGRNRTGTPCGAGF